MRGTVRKLGLLAAVTMLPAGAAEVNHSWETLVQTLKPDQAVVVTQMNGRKAEGSLLSLSQEAIEVSDSGQPVSIQREEVFRVRIANIRQKRTLIGLGIGVVAGAIIGGTGADRYKAWTALFGAGVAGGIGAAAGGAIPIGKPLYEAPGGLKKKAP